MATSPLARILSNALNTRCIPIVFVPGIMGSRLHFTKSDQVWDPDNLPYMGVHWGMIWAKGMMAEMDFAKSPAEVFTRSPKLQESRLRRDRGWNGIVWSYYGKFLELLESHPFLPARCPVYSVGYDWRQSNRDSGMFLTTKISDILRTEKAKKVIILTHSMGGLVARSALKDSSTLAEQVAGVVHVVQPAHGAVWPYRCCFTGLSASEDGSGRAKVLGNTGAKFGAVVSVLPGVMELLPNELYRDSLGSNWLHYSEPSSARQDWMESVYDQYLSPSTPPGLPDCCEEVPGGVLQQVHERIEAAKKFHNWLGDYTLPGKTYSIYGTGVETDTAIFFKSQKTQNPTPESGTRRYDGYRPPGYGDKPPAGGHGALPWRVKEGDGTVPQSSANALFQTIATTFDPKSDIRQFEVNPLEHGTAYLQPAVQKLVLQILNHILGY